ncbi:hypothetical protein D3C79_791720 [compost metagenome]
MSIVIVCRKCDGVVFEHEDNMCAHCYYMSKDESEFYTSDGPITKQKLYGIRNVEVTTMSNVGQSGDVLLVGTFKTRSVLAKDAISDADPMTFEPGDTCLVWITGHAAACVAYGDSILPSIEPISVDNIDWSVQIPLMALTQRLSSLELK